MLTSEVLMAAKARIQRDGWHQGDFTHGKRVCMAGAIFTGSQLPHSYSRCAAHDLLRAVTGMAGTGYTIAPWNDAPERTLQEVYDAFDAAIAIAQQQERANGETTISAVDARADRAVAVSLG